ncbi:MAG TPA: hypothetical protein VHK90_02550, partial [Thermoanaerobaculia bacterium]|nr:hypothetical protein [Thermoanaerobaculia bacterium]
MRTTLAALILAALTALAFAQDPPKPLSIAVEPLGDTDAGVAARVSFRFPSPAEVAPDSPLFLQGSFIQGGQVLRNFRYAVEQGSTSVTSVQAFGEGEVEIDVRLLMPVEEGAPVIIAKTSEKFTLAKTGKVFVASNEDGAEAILAEGVIPETVGAVKIRPPKRDVAP